MSEPIAHNLAGSLLERLPARVGPARMAHIERVVALSTDLADRFGLDVERARLAAAAHDWDRDLPPWQLYSRVADFSIPLLPVEWQTWNMVHGPVTAARLEREWGVRDSEVVDAVRHHTLGWPGFGPIGLILFVADYAEPGRRHLSASDRDMILSQPTLEDSVARAIESARRRWPQLEEGTERLYARVTKGSSWLDQ